MCDGSRQVPQDIKLSKSLSYLLRHGALKEGVQFDTSGYLNVTDILKHPQFCKYSCEDVSRVAENSDKQRCAIRTCPQTGQLQIRANQGHSVSVDIDYKLIQDASEMPVIIHGTKLSSWNKIEKMGLSHMNRTHIHFATGLPGDDGVISGMRRSCDIYIYVNGKKAMDDGYRFYRSTNNVLLCSGNASGLLPVQYFQKVVQVDRRKPNATVKILIGDDRE